MLRKKDIWDLPKNEQKAFYLSITIEQATRMESMSKSESIKYYKELKKDQVEGQNRYMDCRLQSYPEKELAPKPMMRHGW